MTRFIIAGRQSGKTTAAAQWVRGGIRRQLVVPDAMQADWVRGTHFPGALDLHPDAIIPYSALMSGRTRGQRFNELAVDNLDMLLTSLFGYQVSLVTATGDLASPSPNTIRTGGNQ